MQSRGRIIKAKKNNQISPLLVIFLFMCGMVCIGLFITVLLAPGGDNNGPSTNSIIQTIGNIATPIERKTIKQKIKEWMGTNAHTVASPVTPPDWSKEFWTPIDVLDVASDPIVILCKLNFEDHADDPHVTPMFKDLVGKSKCIGSNRRRELLRVLVKEINDNPDKPENRIVQPNGFVFHESRVGSTLVANLLASDPYALVFSESAPMANALLHCDSCTREKSVQLFRDVGMLMGRSPIHTRLFFKFQSITVTQMDIALEAFPDTPWAFIFRQPVQTMMSHMDPKKAGSHNAPCMRSKRHPPKEVRAAIAEHVTDRIAPNEAWCAAHLNMLCEKALEMYDKYSKRIDATTGSEIQRALLINYDSLPGYVAKVVLPHFGVNPVPLHWLQKMKQESDYYSKGRGGERVFTSDSEDKDHRATERIQLYANKILGPTFDLLNTKAMDSLMKVVPSIHTSIINSMDSELKTPPWQLLKEIPRQLDDQGDENLGDSSASGMLRGGGTQDAVTSDAGSAVERGHSHALPEKEFVPWAPFTNHHSSKPYERVDCPLKPERDYPKAYSMIDILNNWNTDNTDIPAFHYDSLCHFDYSNATQLKQAYDYRAAEKPFIVYNIPEVDEVVRKWNDIEYLSNLLGSKKYRTETSDSNHFMYWRHARGKFLRSEEGKNWKEPTKIVSTRFEDWLEVAVKGQNLTLEDRKHEYFRVSSDAGNSWLFDELPFFKPKKSLFLVRPQDQRGIHCRFGMRNVIAEAHFDGSRNSVVELGGLRRWILTHPDQCSNMYMLPPNHPSGRHSAVDWSKPDIRQYPDFARVMGNEVILRPGDMLFVPTYWIHYIVSININFQCNSRSGSFSGYDKHIRACGFM